MSKKEQIYFTFPVGLLNGAFDDITEVCNNIMDYAIYKHSLSIKKPTETERINAAISDYGIECEINSRFISNGETLVNSYNDKTALSSINHKMLFDFYKNYKSEFDIACFLAFAAIKSILGKKEYCKTNKEFIIIRMFGYNSINELPEFKHELYYKYMNRYHIDKVLTELQLSWYLNLFSDHCRGFYLSFDVPLEQLAKINIESKKSIKLNELKNAKKEALLAAKEALKNK